LPIVRNEALHRSHLMYPSRRPRPAFRLGELIAVVFFLIIGVGLLLPALQQPRVKASRTQCINNNKQLGLAVHNYAFSYQKALPALTSDVKAPKFGRYNGGVLFTLLPYLEQEDRFAAATRQLPDCTWYGPMPPDSILPFSAQGTASRSFPLCTLPLKVFACEADESARAGLLSANESAPYWSTASPSDWAGSSYSANYQVFGSQNDLGSKESGNACWPKYNIDNVPDGTSNTVFFGEQFAACGNSAGNLWAYPGIGNYSGTEYTSTPGARAPSGIGNSIVNTPKSTNSNLWSPVFANSHGARGFSTGGLAGSIFEFNNKKSVPTPLQPPYAMGQYWDAPPQIGITPDQCDKSRLQSFHTGNVVVCMGDGSTRVIGGLVSQATWHAAIVPDDGVALGTDW
jgi:hypothetical protein